LRGIYSVDGKIAWASGTGGTVLRTLDGGAHWEKCSVPGPDGETLDFRGVQAWDGNAAMIMASGPGDKSRLYRTEDGCKTWKLTFKNPDKKGFWDALYFDRPEDGWLFGDPVRGSFSLFASSDRGKHWIRQHNKGLKADAAQQGAFAASNSSLTAFGGFVTFVSGGTGGAQIYSVSEATICVDCSEEEDYEGRDNNWTREKVPLGIGTASSGAFSIGSRHPSKIASLGAQAFVVVGGDFSHPEEPNHSAIYKLSYDQPWTAATTPPRGYRSSVQWSEDLKAWITVGTNGSDISRDDGKTWQPMDDGNWNALSLPFVVGPKGRIARLTILKAEEK
jgi:photosystem II stability/assembly factor-like uncharacterized protein